MATVCVCVCVCNFSPCWESEGSVSRMNRWRQAWRSVWMGAAWFYPVRDQVGTERYPLCFTRLSSISRPNYTSKIGYHVQRNYGCGQIRERLPSSFSRLLIPVYSHVVVMWHLSSDSGSTLFNHSTIFRVNSMCYVCLHPSKGTYLLPLLLLLFSFLCPPRPP